MFREKCRVLSNEKIAPGHFVLRFASSQIGRDAKAGQFVQILCDDSFEPLLPRPFSFLTANKKDFSVLYQVVGKGTTLLSKIKKDDAMWVSGPFGNGFNSNPAKSSTQHLLVGGGVGIPPLVHFAEQLLKNGVSKKNIHVFLGARDKSLLLCEKDFKKMGVNLNTATDNGSKGVKGFVTQILEAAIKDGKPETFKIFTCGPTPMLKAVSKLAEKHNVLCEVSVEVPMACGFGACLGCAIKVKQDGGHRFAIACCEGPVFEGKEVLWV